jgi:hypothetical protein
MQLIWLAPAAALGLIALAVPVLIHLLTNQQRRHVAFPSLRFLRPTRLAAIRRRSLQNWLLLTVRVLVIAAVVGALAGPVMVSSTREEEWQRRVARAVVVAPGGSAATEIDALIEAERGDAFVSEVFRPAMRLADGLRDAAVWLQKQPPAAREVVVLGDLKIGAIGAADLDLVPSNSGLRFLPVPARQTSGAIDLPFQEGTTAWRARTTLHDTATSVAYARTGPAAIVLSVRAAPEEQALADAALHALLARGVEVDRMATRRARVLFEGASTEDLRVTKPPESAWMREVLAALPDMRGGASGDTLVVQIPRRAADPDAARLLQRAARAIFADDHTSLEPLSIPAVTLAEWSRPSGAIEPGRPSDEGDRRWLWAAALVLLGVENVIRRRRSVTDEAAAVAEAHVA